MTPHPISFSGLVASMTPNTIVPGSIPDRPPNSSVFGWFTAKFGPRRAWVGPSLSLPLGGCRPPRPPALFLGGSCPPDPKGLGAGLLVSARPRASTKASLAASVPTSTSTRCSSQRPWRRCPTRRQPCWRASWHGACGNRRSSKAKVVPSTLPCMRASLAMPCAQLFLRPHRRPRKLSVQRSRLDCLVPRCS
jgi:hypothetical protein